MKTAVTRHGVDGTSTELKARASVNRLQVSDSGRHLVMSLEGTHSVSVDLRNGAARRIDAAVTTLVGDREVVVDRKGVTSGLDGSEVADLDFPDPFDAYALYDAKNATRFIGVTDWQISWFDLGGPVRKVDMGSGFGMSVTGCTVAPSGSSIACPMGTESGSTLFVVDLDNGKVRRLDGVHQAAYSRSGELAYAVERGKRFEQAIVIESPSGSTRELKPATRRGDGSWIVPNAIEWSPDGKRLAVSFVALR